MVSEKMLVLGGLLIFVVTEAIAVVMSLVVGFTPAMVAPVAIVILLAILAWRGIRWARWLLVVMAALRLVVAAGWFIDAVKATVESKRFIGL